MIFIAGGNMFFLCLSCRYPRVAVAQALRSICLIDDFVASLSRVSWRRFGNVMGAKERQIGMWALS